MLRNVALVCDNWRAPKRRVLPAMIFKSLKELSFTIQIVGRGKQYDICSEETFISSKLPSLSFWQLASSAIFMAAAQLRP